MYLVIFLVAIYVCQLVVKWSRSKRRQHTIFFCQYICDDVYPKVVSQNKEYDRAEDLSRRREEYLEWINNCNQVFERNSTNTDRKVCRRTIDGVA